ncbi:hypothetical protein ElyMa_000400000 [Elysia marginata]|uniref:Uncharacterized protein n=1 Tax=Elysia marginata TaxID=1093978 RepID=A0AAV4FJQ3_9GAST|nr:hypothetical protein ElyMa_000400000 [Elysia marginata]
MIGNRRLWEKRQPLRRAALSLVRCPWSEARQLIRVGATSAKTGEGSGGRIPREGPGLFRRSRLDKPAVKR